MRDGTSEATQYSPARGCPPRVRRGARRAAPVGRSRAPLARSAAPRARRLGSRSRRVCAWRPARSPGARRRAGATPRFASTTSEARCSTAALLGVGSLLLVGRRWIAPVALVYAGLAIGIALAVPLQTEHLRDGDPRGAGRARRSGRRACSRSSGTRSARSRWSSSRSRPSARARVGNALILAGIGSRGDRQRPRRTGRRSASPGDRRRRHPPLRRLRRPGAAREATPTRARRRRRARRRLDDRAGNAPVRTSHA